ncbi:DNA replication complex GINS protein PSF3 isoform X2 [Aquila chrysaetos chrysaetos]|uniref:DNA replication complex GINS protein PSF3 isoform X2 n=1 Tax=Aquila chrysaetos chrysaetos TaxID=223781 RepID=UPI0005D0D78D|nr:DNA replication complex GINS protein PSF3 isoform X2 [Aquila chrysaetos chrysaetos]
MSEAYFPVGPGLGPEENFLSLDDILMSQEKLPGRAESSLPRLAFALGPGAGTGDSIPEGSKLEIPLWLAKGLHDSKRRIISVELPKIYKEAWRTVFSADANVVDLHKMGPYYYGFGSQLLNFDNPENPEIAQSILQVMRSGATVVQSCKCRSSSCLTYPTWVIAVCPSCGRDIANQSISY